MDVLKINDDDDDDDGVSFNCKVLSKDNEIIS